MKRIHYLRGSEMHLAPLLFYLMWRDRAIVFNEREGWDIPVDDARREIDQYDTSETVYVIVEADNGSHAGSLRLLPTTGRTMTNEHFLQCIGGEPIVRLGTWECSRLCLGEGADRLTSSQLLAGTARLMIELDITELLGIFDHKMIRAYQRLGVSPRLLGQWYDGASLIHGGLWSSDEEAFSNLTRRARLDSTELELAVTNSSFVNEYEAKFS